MRRVTQLVLVLFLGSAAAGAQEAEELFTAARAGDLEAVRRLLDAGVEVDATDRYGSTALLMAAVNGQKAVVQELLARDADINHRESFYSADALGMALFLGQREIAILLLENGAENRSAALGFALRQGDPELAKVAIESGPITESQLQAFRARASALDPAFQEHLTKAKSKPDPEPPTLTAADLEAYEGAFEGFTSDLRVDVSVQGGQLRVEVDGGEPIAMTVVAEQTFRSRGGELEISFSGRAGTIEGLVIRRDGLQPENLRRSVAEPIGLAALEDDSLETDRAIEEPTVNWPAFRGSNAAGIGDGVDTLTNWDLESGEGVLFRIELGGLGNSSPVVWGDKVLVTTAVAEGIEQNIRTGLTGAGSSVDEEVSHSWQVLAFDKRTGKSLWKTEVGRGVPLAKRHFKATQANSTPVTDGRHLVVVFPTAGLACLGLDGKLHWKHDLGGLNAGAFSDPGIQWGFASSPILYGSQVILQVDTHGGQYLAAWDLESGEQVWKVERNVAPSWATPTILEGESSDELVANGSTIHAYDPRSGEELWSLGPNSELVMATPVAKGSVVYVSAGYPPVKPIYAVRAGTRGDLQVDPRAGDRRLVWSHGIGGAYLPSPILYRGLLYVVHHNGRLVAYEAESGAAIFKSRFSRGGTFTGSPVAVNGKLYVPTEEGLLYVLQAGPEYKEIAVHEFGEPLMATPAVSSGVLYIRTPSHLIAIGKS